MVSLAIIQRNSQDQWGTDEGIAVPRR